jgi:hypothetical protein
MARLASQSATTLRVLLERLNWPVRMVRMVAAREFAALLSSPEYKEMALAAYLNWLRSRQLESQVATALAVLLCADREHLPLFSLIREAICRPSIVADLMTQHVYGAGNRKGEWLNAHSGLSPEEFVASEYFDDHKRAHVPMIFDNHIRRLEREFWFPFSRQWAFEWQKIMDGGTVPFSDFPYHFLGNLARSGIIGQFELAQSDAMRSAFLRMLACAVAQDAMTARQAGLYAMDCLPLNRGLFRMRPIDRPSWLSDIPEQCCEAGASLQEQARKIIAANINSTDMRPVSILTPIKASLFEFGELTVSAVMVTDDFSPPDIEEPYFKPSAPWFLPDAISFEGQLDEGDSEDLTVMGKTGRCIPICVDIFPIPFGYWMADYLSAGFALPAPYLFSKPPEITCDEGGIRVHNNGDTVGKLTIWHDHWTPLYAKDGGLTRCGVLSEMPIYDLAQALGQHGMHLGWIAQLRLWTRDVDYSEFALSTRREFFFD